MRQLVRNWHDQGSWGDPNEIEQSGRGLNLRKLGIVGGMSWSSTALYYDHINRGVAQRLGGLHSAPLAIESVDFAHIAEMEFTGDWDGIANVTKDAAKRLENASHERSIQGYVDGVFWERNSKKFARKKN